MATVPLLFYGVSYGGRQVFCGGGTAEFLGCYVVKPYGAVYMRILMRKTTVLKRFFIKIFIKIIGILCLNRLPNERKCVTI